MSSLRETHSDQVKRWAEFVRDNPTKWKKTHTQFINALYSKHHKIMNRLSKTKEGREKIKKLFELKRNLR